MQYNPHAKLKKSIMHGTHWSTFWFLAPALTLFLIFVIWPIFDSFIISFTSWDGLGEKKFVGFDNYRDLFQDEKFYTSIKNNILWLAFMLITPVFGLLFALFLNQKIRGIRFVKSMFFFPFVINLVVVGLVFSWFYNPDFGVLAHVLGWVGLSPIPVLSTETVATIGIIIAAMWPQIAYCMVLYLTGLTRISEEVIEAARIDGSHGIHMLFNIILPELRPATFIAYVVTVIGSLRSFDLIAIMTAGGPWGSSYVLAYHMYVESIFNFKMGYGAAIATILFLIMSVYIAWFLYRLLKREPR